MRSMTVAVVCVLAAAVGGCGGESPQVSFGTMCIERLGVDAIDYLATVLVSNPNDEPMSVDEIHWRLTGDGQTIAEKNEVRAIELLGRKTTPVCLRVQVPASGLAAAGLADRRRFNYEFTGQFHMASALGGSTLGFRASGIMPIIQPLDVKLQSIDRVTAGETHVHIVMTVLVTNGNDIPLTPTALKGDLVVNGRPLIALETVIEQTVSVPPGATSQVKIPVDINSAEFGVRTLQGLLTTPGTLIRLVALVTFRGPGEADVNDIVVPPTTQPR